MSITNLNRGWKVIKTQSIMHYFLINYRISWIFTVLGCGYLSIFLIVDSLSDFMRHPILYAFPDEIPVENIPFPSFTITPPNIMRNSDFNNAIQIYLEADLENATTFKADGHTWSRKEALILIHLLDHICKSAFSYLKKLNVLLRATFELAPYYSFWIQEKINITMIDDPGDSIYTDKILPFIGKGMLDCRKIITGCRWRGLNFPCSKLFVPEQTEVGTGCAFNKMPNEIISREKSLQWNINKHNFTKQELDAWNNWDLENDVQLHDGYDDKDELSVPRRQNVAGRDNGLSMTLHFEKNQDDFGCPVIDGSAYMVDLHPSIEHPQVLMRGIPIPPNSEVFIQIKAIVTVADDRVKNSLGPSERRCYIAKENPLKYYRKYTAGNCRAECLSRKIFETCKCFLLSLPGGHKEQICGPLEMKCAAEVKQKVETMGYGKACSDPQCYPPCTEVTYQVQSYTIPYNDDKVARKDDLGLTPNTSTSIVHAYFTRETMETRERKRQYDWAQLLGLIGGILGLMFGFTMTQVIKFVAKLVRVAYETLFAAKDTNTSIVSPDGISNSSQQSDTELSMSERADANQRNLRRIRVVKTVTNATSSFCTPHSSSNSPIPIQNRRENRYQPTNILTDVEVI